MKKSNLDDKTIHTNFFRYELAQALKRNLKDYPLGTLSIKEDAGGFLCVFVYDKSFFRITYGIDEDRVYLTETTVKSSSEKHIKNVQSVLEKAFGSPTVKYDMGVEGLTAVLTNTTLEWAQKGKEKELIDELQKGYGFVPGTSPKNLEILYKTPSERT